MIIELWATFSSLLSLFAIAGYIKIYFQFNEVLGQYKEIYSAADTYLGEIATYFQADQDSKVSILEPEMMLAATVHFIDKSKIW
jgi:hypothetical protein